MIPSEQISASLPRGRIRREWSLEHFLRPIHAKTTFRSTLLADRTNSRAIGTVLRLSSVTWSIVAKRCVLEQKLLLTGWQPIGSRIWEIYWYQNEWPWPLFKGRIKVTSTVALHLTSNISETVTDRGLVPKDHHYEMTYGLSNGHVTNDVTWHWKVKLVTPKINK